MKTIKFDLPIDGVKVANVDDLGYHLTPEILGHFRSGVLAKWLRAQGSEEQLAVVEKLPEDGSDRHLLLELCKLFQVDAAEHSVAAALATPTDVPGVRTGRKIIPAGGRASGRLAHGREDKWHLEVPNAALVTIEISALVNIICSLENAHGAQLAIEGDEIETKSPRIRAVLSEGIYYIRLRSYFNKPFDGYNLDTSQEQKFALARADGNSIELNVNNLMEEKNMDDTYNATGKLKKKYVDVWVVNERTNKIQISVSAPGIKDLRYRIYDGHGQPIRDEFSAFERRVRDATVLEHMAESIGRVFSVKGPHPYRITRIPGASKIIEEQFGEFIIAVWSPSGITGNYSLTLQTYSEHSHKKIRSLAIILEGKGMSPTLRKKGFFWPFADYRYHPDKS